MKKKLLDILACPVCKGKLHYNKKKSELECEHDKIAFPLRDGVPILLEMDARKITPENK